MTATATTKFELRPYQQVGVEYLRGRKRAALFMTAQEGSEQ